jgi:hypothetical protein
MHNVYGLTTRPLVGKTYGPNRRKVPNDDSESTEACGQASMRLGMQVVLLLTVSGAEGAGPESVCSGRAKVPYLLLSPPELGPLPSS